MDAATALTAILTPLVQMGLPGIAIIGLGFWVNRQQKRIDDLTDKLVTVGSEATKASGEAAAAINRLADAFSRGKPE